MNRQIKFWKVSESEIFDVGGEYIFHSDVDNFYEKVYLRLTKRGKLKVDESPLALHQALLSHFPPNSSPSLSTEFSNPPPNSRTTSRQACFGVAKLFNSISTPS